MKQHVLAFLTLTAAILFVPSVAQAQYQNNAFGLDVGGWLITKPSVLDANGEILAPDNRPARLSNGFRLGGESNIKMDADHWWFSGRVNLGFPQYASGNANGTLEEQFDAAASETLGTLMGIQGGIGVRYVFMTDRIRPYMQLGLSYLRLFSFNSAASQECVEAICGSSGSNEASYLPHPNIGGVHLQPGIEYIFTRDIGLHFFADVQRWLIFNTADNTAVVIGAGFIFFT